MEALSAGGKAQKFRWSKLSEDMFAVADTEKVELFTIKEERAHSIQKMDGHASAVSWHASEAICAVAMGSCLKILSASV